MKEDYKISKILILNSIIIASISSTFFFIPPAYALPNLDSIFVTPQSPNPVTHGNEAKYFVVVSREDLINGFEATLSLEGTLPDGVQGNFEPSELTFPPNEFMPQFSTLKVLTSGSSPPGDFQITIKASTGSEEVTKTVNLSITDVGTDSSSSTTKHRSNDYYEEYEPEIAEPEPDDSPEIDLGLGYFKAKPLSQNVVTLDWSSTFENQGLLVTSYKIERKIANQTNFVEVANLNPQFLKYSDDNLVGNTPYVYRISEMIYNDVLYTSNEVNATTSAFVNGKAAKMDRTPPLTKEIKFVSEENGTINDGFGGKIAETEFDKIPNLIMQTGKEENLEIHVSDNGGISAIKGVTVNMYVDYGQKKNDTYFMYDEESEKLTVSDPLEIFANVNVYRTYSKGEMILDFFFIPEKPMPLTDLVISSWDNQLNSKNSILPNAFVILGEPLNQEQTEFQLDGQQKSNKFTTLEKYFDSDGNVKTLDSFGNLVDFTEMSKHDPFEYGEDIGKSKRIDEGFTEKKMAENAKAKIVIDDLLKRTFIVEIEPESPATVFDYPDYIGHMDRGDLDLLKNLMDEETLKAQNKTK